MLWCLHQERLCARCPNRADGLLWPQRRWFVISRRADVTHILYTSIWALQHNSIHMHKYIDTLYSSLTCNLQAQAGNQPGKEKWLKSLTLLTYEGVGVLDTLHELLSDFFLQNLHIFGRSNLTNATVDGSEGCQFPVNSGNAECRRLQHRSSIAYSPIGSCRISSTKKMRKCKTLSARPNVRKGSSLVAIVKSPSSSSGNH